MSPAREHVGPHGEDHQPINQPPAPRHHPPPSHPHPFHSTQALRSHFDQATMVRTRRKSSKSSFSRKAGKPAVKRAAPKRAGNNAADTEAVMRMWLMLWAFLLIGQVKKTISCRSAPPPSGPQ